jgi:hypothetical protein
VESFAVRVDSRVRAAGFQGAGERPGVQRALSGIRPMPSLRSAGTGSSSMVRTVRLYRLCSEVWPRKCRTEAEAWARAMSKKSMPASIAASVIAKPLDSSTFGRRAGSPRAADVLGRDR